jgi:thiosulfate/3-mercaptopyruvate sulfurtransferase
LDVQASELPPGSEAFSLIDTRSAWERILNRIPGSVHIPWTEFHSGADRRPLPREALQRLLQRKGVSLSRPVVYYCSGGVRSAYAWLVHELAGVSNARNYGGGMEEWKKLR